MTSACEWQPIETAPKDGALVDLWVADETDSYRFPDCRWLTADGGDGWYGYDGIGEGYWLSEAGEVATHWMPLPTPPASGQVRP